MAGIEKSGNLLEKIPGLEAHQVRAPKPEPQKHPFKEKLAKELMFKTVGQVNYFLTGEALSWLMVYRRDQVEAMKRAEAACDEAFLARDWFGLERALYNYGKACRQAVEVFEKREPAIEVEETLF